MKLKLLSIAVATMIGGCSTFPIRQDIQDTHAIKDVESICQQKLTNSEKFEIKDREECAKDSVYQVVVDEKNEKDFVQTYILEFNDQGILTNPKTAEAALKYLKKEMDEKANKPIVSLFVHGWNNNAEADNTNLIDFEWAAMALNNSQEKNAQSQVVAIYVSWRGKTMPTGLSHALTFWGRKAVSEEIGRGELAKIIFELEKVLKPNDKAHGKLILSGHSFGASALYNAVGQELLSRFYTSLKEQEMNKDEKVEIRGVGDIVILLNPAIQALRFRSLRETIYEKAVQRPNIFENNKAPIFMMVATEDDLPVETAFPIGRTISHFLSHNDSKTLSVYQGINGNIENKWTIKHAERNSIGFYAPYYTHFLLLADNIKSEQGSPLYGIVNASQKVLSAPKKIIDKTSEVLNKTTDSVEQEPIEIIEKENTVSVEQNKPVEQDKMEVPLNISSCFSNAIHKEFESGERKTFNWIEEAIAGQGAEETFTTVRKTELSGNKEIDLLKLKITNNPSSLKAGQVNHWPLLQQYKKDEVLSWKRNPYWFVKAKSNVMQGHSGIWNANVACLLLSVMATETFTRNFVDENPQTDSTVTDNTSKDESTLNSTVENSDSLQDQSEQSKNAIEMQKEKTPELESEALTSSKSKM